MKYMEDDVIAWLRTPAGERWSESRIAHDERGGLPGRHSLGRFASIKSDHTCHYDARTGEYTGCWPNELEFKWLDEQLKQDIELYGMNGLPPARQVAQAGNES